MRESTPKNSIDIQPATALWKLYQPHEAPRALNATDVVQARQWQKRTRHALAQRIGLNQIHSASPRARILEKVDKRDYVREKIVLRTGPDTLMPVYFLLPKNAVEPLPVVLAFHGHGYGVKDIVGLWEDGQERDTPDGYHKDFAVALCRAGFAVAAPEISCFGERQTDFSYLEPRIGQDIPTTCTHSAMLAFRLGASVVGLRVHDGMRLVDYLETRQEVDVSCLGAMPLSGRQQPPSVKVLRASGCTANASVGMGHWPFGGLFVLMLMVIPSKLSKTYVDQRV